MEFCIENTHPATQCSACVVAGVLESRQLTAVAEQLDNSSKGYISDLLRRGELEGKADQTLLLHQVRGVAAERVLLMGCGKAHELDEQQYKRVIRRMLDTLNNTGSTEAVCYLAELSVKDRDIYWKVRQLVETVCEGLYRFHQLKTHKDESPRPLGKLIINVSDPKALPLAERGLQHGLAIAAGISAAKDLANMPPNICNAPWLAEQAQQLAISYSQHLKAEIIDETQMQALGMHSWLAVGKGSENPSLMTLLHYQGASGQQPIVLVGKGLTFDSGGISIKPAAEMDEMKYDMCGAAAVFGVMRTVAELQLPLNIIGLMACCENMPDSKSYRPGDILTTMSGQTVEVLNTDAEGRMVLCDALTYVERFKPQAVIDIATLTGACIIALGHHISGLIANHNPLAHELISASEQACDRAWQLPMAAEYQQQLDSNFADIANIGGRPAGSITAGCFLSRFTSNYHWAHLDIAGTGWRSGKEKGATGRPVAMLTQFLLNRARLNGGA